MKKVFLIIVCCLFLLAGCNSPKDPLSPKAVLHQLTEMKNSSQQLQIMPNPATVYDVDISEELLIMLNIDNWSEITSDNSNTDITAMLYFDLQNPEVENSYTRVAILSNGYALLQIYSDQGFAERRWYTRNCTEDNSLEAIMIYIIENSQDKGGER